MKKKQKQVNVVWCHFDHDNELKETHAQRFSLGWEKMRKFIRADCLEELEKAAKKLGYDLVEDEFRRQRREIEMSIMT
jgi:hypothetical protein